MLRFVAIWHFRLTSNARRLHDNVLLTDYSSLWVALFLVLLTSWNDYQRSTGPLSYLSLSLSLYDTHTHTHRGVGHRGDKGAQVLGLGTKPSTFKGTDGITVVLMRTAFGFIQWMWKLKRESRHHWDVFCFMSIQLHKCGLKCFLACTWSSTKGRRICHELWGRIDVYFLG